MIARFDATRRDIAELGVLADDAKDARAYNTRASQLQEPATALGQLVVLVQEFRRRHIVIELNVGQLRALAYQARLLRESFREDHTSIITTSSEIGARFFDPLQNVCGEVRGALQRAWMDYVDAMLPSLQQPELLNTLSRLPGFHERVAEINRLHGKAASLRGRLPQSSEEIDGVAMLAAELRAAWAALPTEGMPPDIRTFLAAAVDGEARLSQLTASVVEWLRVNKLDDSIRISLRAQTP